MKSILIITALLFLAEARLAGQGEELQPWQIVLTGDEASKVGELEDQLNKLLDDGKLVEALKVAREIEAIRFRVQGKDHWETVDVSWHVKTLLTVLALPEPEQAAYPLARSVVKEAQILHRQGRNAEVRPLCERAIELWKRLVGEDHPFTAGCYTLAARNLRALGKYTEAQPFFEKSLALKKKHLGDEHPISAQGYDDLASVLGSQGKHTEAQPLSEKALAITRRVLGEEHSQTSGCYNNLAFILGNEAKYAEAQPLYEKALALTKKLVGEEHRETALSYNNLAFNLNAQGKYSEAQPLFEKALALRKKLVGEEHMETARTYNNLALNLRDQGRAVEAQPFFERSLAIRKKLLGDDHPATITGYANLALSLSAQGKYAEAQPLFEKAKASSTRNLGEQHPDTAIDYNNLASNLASLGKYAEAQPLLETALAIKKNLLGDNHTSTARAYCSLAVNLDSQRKHVEAQPLHTTGLGILKQLLGEEHELTANAYESLARCLDAQGQGKDAITYWTLAAKSFEAARLHVSTSGLGRAEFSARSPLTALASALARDGQPLAAWRYWERSLARGLLDDLSSRQARRISPEDDEHGRRLAGEIQGLDACITASAGPAAKTRAPDIEALRQKRLELQAELSALDQHLADTYGVAEGKAYEIQEVQAALPEDAALIGWLDEENRLKGNERADGHWAVVVRRKGDPRWVRLQGSDSADRWSEEDAALGRKVSADLADRNRLPRPVDGERLEKLARQRLGAVEETLNEAGAPLVRRLIVLPSSDLRAVPVALLAERYTVSYAPSGSVLAWLREKKNSASAPKTGSLLALGDPAFRRPDETEPGPEPAPPEHGVYLALVVRGSNAEKSGLREGDVLLAYAEGSLEGARDLPGAMERAKGKPQAQVKLWRRGKELEVTVAAGELGVRLDQRPPRQAMEAEREFAMALRGLRDGNASYQPLPGTRKEVEAIAGKFRGRVEKLLGADASKPRLNELLLTGKLRDYSYLHFATHGVLNRERAFDSALILSAVPDSPGSSASRPESVDGMLTAAEILHSWSLEAELVVLSACQTALGAHAGGEGYLGFSQALLLAGAKAVVLSLWKVDDTATGLLMERFYENLFAVPQGVEKRMGKAEALREAQMWLRGLKREQVQDCTARLDALAAEKDRGNVRPLKQIASPVEPLTGSAGDHPFSDPYYWAAFILIGDPE